MGNGLYNFLGSLLVLLLAILIFFTLMSSEMPDKNRELLIAFISVLFGGMAASIKSIPMPNKCGGGILYMNTISSLYQPCSYEYDEHINSKRRCFCAMKRDYRVYGIDSMYIENSYISLPYTIYKKYIYNVTEMNIRETVLVYNYKKYVDGRIENLM